MAAGDPGHWIPAHDHQKQRRDRGAQLLRLHSACLRAEAGDGDVPGINSRDVEAEATDQALRREDIEILWAAELIDSSKNFGHALRRRCVLRLNSKPADFEAKLALRWLDHRGRPR
jgi:hypothetical protein